MGGRSYTTKAGTRERMRPKHRHRSQKACVLEPAKTPGTEEPQRAQVSMRKSKCALIPTGQIQIPRDGPSPPASLVLMASFWG
ncbi:hypothetical protein NDU88_001456 [Pleurodeles waltl]|uniref:Uncharacterized protein n=1 Tax=Pleurodeles waltl TaxID=8319 RepID=A0AAV7TID0_PLEWA|nr:hypothetical protein NDU88_001456 [Pleurodeles waltl]